MCTILLAWRCLPGAPIVVAANRDELIGRPSRPPAVIHRDPLILGGLDLQAGGSWLAVSADGRIAAVTNRWLAPAGEAVRDPTRLSRGEIPVAVLRGGGDAAVPEFLAGLGPGVYNPVNVLYVSAQRALVAHVDDSGPPRVTELEPGAHVLTVFDLDELARPKVSALRGAVSAALGSATDAGTLAETLRHVLASHETPSGDPLDAPCIHGEVYGTVSSSSVVIAGADIDYRHADGRPCVTPFGVVRSPSESAGRSPARD